MIDDLSYQGLGVAKKDGRVIFVNDALPGEVVVAKILKVQKSLAFAKAISHKQVSDQRVKIKNARYTQTGIAPLQHLSYEGQLEFKRQQVKNVLHKVHLDGIEVKPTLGMAEPYAYRNKAAVPIRKVDGKLVAGFFRRNSHDFVPLADFLIQDKRIDEVIQTTLAVLNEFGIDGYDEAAHKGCVKTLLVRRGHYSGEVMVVIVTIQKTLPHARQIAEKLHARCPDVVSIYQNENLKPTNVILGATNTLLFGQPTIKDSLNGLEFELSPHSFYQINPTQTEKLYNLAVKLAALDGSQTVIDAYCGIGTISLHLARAAKHVYGVEVVKQAIDDAKQNAHRNGLANCTFVAGSTEEWMAKWQHQGKKPDVVVFDPPRKGLAESVIASTKELAPKKVIYVSCNPATLARDLVRFIDAGYTVASPVYPVDQFPQTPHVESVTVLERKK